MSGDTDWIPRRVIVSSEGDEVGGQPRWAVQELGLTELIGADEQVDQDEYGGSVGIALGTGVSGELLHVTLYAKETGTGAVLTPEGVLYFFDADPSISPGDTEMSAADRESVIGQIPVAAADWESDANGASVSVFNKPVAFHAVSTLYVVWFHTDATSFNDAGGDDEVLEFNGWYRRDS